MGRTDRTGKPGSPKDREEAHIRALLRAGTTEHYEDAALYDHEYLRRRADVNFYRRVAKGMKGGVLELGCGTGRLLLPLVRDGHRVLGVDRSRAMLQRCVQRLGRLTRARQAQAQLLRADFRELPLTEGDGGRFPLILCPFNAFMHLYDRTDVERFLHQVRTHLQPSGLFVFDVINPDLTWLSRDPERRWARTRFRHPTTGERLIYSTNNTYDPVRQIAMVRIFYEPVDERKSSARQGPGELIAADTTQSPANPLPRGHMVYLAHRQFFPEELSALLHYNGFHIEQREGGFDGQLFTPESTEQVIRARVR